MSEGTMAEDKIATLYFKTEGEVDAFKRGLFWHRQEFIAADMITSGLLPEGKWCVEVIEVGDN